MRPHSSMTRRELTSLALNALRRSFPCRDYKLTCPAALLLRFVLWAAACSRTLSALFQSFAPGCGRETARKAFRQLQEGWTDLDEQINQSLTLHFPKGLRKKPQVLAIDQTNVPSYEQKPKTKTHLVPGSREAGTNYFHAYATVYLILRGKRFTLAVMAVDSNHSWKQILQTLLGRLRRLEVPIRLLLLDRGFWSAEVVQYLKASHVPFLMPVIGRGRKLDHPKGPTCTNVFFGWKHSGFTDYTFKRSKTVTRTVKVRIAVVRIVEDRSERKRRTLVYAYGNFEPKSPHWVRETYRKRFAIESSYRQGKQSRVRTSSQDWEVHYFWMGVSLLLRNVWVWLHEQVLSEPRRGGREYRPKSLCYSSLQITWSSEVESGWKAIETLVIPARNRRAVNKMLKV